MHINVGCSFSKGAWIQHMLRRGCLHVRDCMTLLQSLASAFSQLSTLTSSTVSRVVGSLAAVAGGTTSIALDLGTSLFRVWGRPCTHTTLPCPHPLVPSARHIVFRCSGEYVRACVYVFACVRVLLRRGLTRSSLSQWILASSWRPW
jgi:hypothetical protein